MEHKRAVYLSRGRRRVRRFPMSGQSERPEFRASAVASAPRCCAYLKTDSGSVRRRGLMTDFSLVTVWELAAPLQRVWHAIHDVDQWPRWWPYVERVATLEA